MMVMVKQAAGPGRPSSEGKMHSSRFSLTQVKVMCSAPSRGRCLMVTGPGLAPCGVWASERISTPVLLLDQGGPTKLLDSLLPPVPPNIISSYSRWSLTLYLFYFRATVDGKYCPSPVRGYLLVSKPGVCKSNLWLSALAPSTARRGGSPQISLPPDTFPTPSRQNA